MSLSSSSFLIFIALVVIAYHLTASVAYRRLVMTLANAAFIASYVGGIVQVLPLLGFLLLSYVGLQAVRWRPRGVSLAVGISVVLATYVILKRFSLIANVVQLPFPYLIIGLSYILFRVLHLMVDARSGNLPDGIGPLAFFRYTCNFLCFVSGPIQRYQDFSPMDGVEIVPLDADRVYTAFSRVVTGYIRFAVVAEAADYVYLTLAPHLSGTGPMLWVLFAVCAAAYTAYLYLNFSGYMDIVIGIGMLLGMSLPENFNRPFSARSFLEFWQRWHMTLSEWFKLYVFTPLLMRLMTRWPSPQLTAYLGVFAFFVTFLIMGIWHGSTLVFVIYGLLMGAGASGNKLWQIFCADRLGKRRYRTLSQTPTYVYLARGLTFSYFTVALTCLWEPALPQYLALAGRLGVIGICAAFVLLALGFALSALTFDAGWAWVRARAGSVPVLGGALIYRNTGLAVRILAVLMITSLFNRAPEFVYKAF
jgi:alginate O-acetyltransferase complex protein AlgI